MNDCHIHFPIDPTNQTLKSHGKRTPISHFHVILSPFMKYNATGHSVAPWAAWTRPQQNAHFAGAPPLQSPSASWQVTQKPIGHHLCLMVVTARRQCVDKQSVR